MTEIHLKFSFEIKSYSVKTTYTDWTKVTTFVSYWPMDQTVITLNTLKTYVWQFKIFGSFHIANSFEGVTSLTWYLIIFVFCILSFTIGNSQIPLKIISRLNFFQWAQYMLTKFSETSTSEMTPLMELHNSLKKTALWNLHNLSTIIVPLSTCNRLDRCYFLNFVFCRSFNALSCYAMFWFFTNWLILFTPLVSTLWTVQWPSITQATD